MNQKNVQNNFKYLYEFHLDFYMSFRKQKMIISPIKIYINQARVCDHGTCLRPALVIQD